ncbi:MAG: transposase, partial [Terriglobales bacterium]
MSHRQTKPAGARYGMGGGKGLQHGNRGRVSNRAYPVAIHYREYGPMVSRLERDLPELLSVFAFPKHLWQKLRTTNIIERCFVEVRRRTRPMVCFVN